jgi:hypothetical protein
MALALACDVDQLKAWRVEAGFGLLKFLHSWRLRRYVRAVGYRKFISFPFPQRWHCAYDLLFGCITTTVVLLAVKGLAVQIRWYNSWVVATDVKMLDAVHIILVNWDRRSQTAVDQVPIHFQTQHFNLRNVAFRSVLRGQWYSRSDLYCKQRY